MTFHVRTRALAASKRGNAPDEYEDACWPRRDVDRSVNLFRCAIADGATEASFSALWAGMLTRAYCRAQLSNGRFARAFGDLQGSWAREVASRPLPWYAEEKVRQGAFAALLGLTITADGWSALACGDSCLAQVRRGRLLTFFPVTCSRHFTNAPYLLSSRAQPSADRLCAGSGSARGGDVFYLMTDALACWFLGRYEAGQRPWREIRSLNDDACFARWLAERRATGALRNDDTTLLRVELL